VSYRPLSGQRLEEISLGLMADPGAERRERYSKPHVIEKKKSPRAASNASS